MKWPSRSASAARNSAKTSSSVISGNRLQMACQPDRAGPLDHQARGRLRTGGRLPIRRRVTPPGTAILRHPRRPTGVSMKTIFKLFAIAAAFGLAPATAFAQAAAPAPAAEKAAPPSDSISAASQAAPAQPQEVSDPAIANIGTEEPSDATVANATMASRATPTPGIGQPDGRMGFQDQVTEIGERASWFHNWILLPIITVISVFVLGLLL